MIVTNNYAIGYYLSMCMLPPFPSDTELLIVEKFPYPEGKQYEFKNSLFISNKIIPTICAFLNTDGGYLVFGVDDSTLEITGLKATTKEVDVFILDNIDKIFHNSIIINKDDFTTLKPHNLKSKVLWKNNKVIVIVTVLPDEGAQYQVDNGTMYYRANASNLKVRTDKMYNEFSVNSMLQSQKKHLTKEYDMTIRALVNEARRHKKYIGQLEASIKHHEKSKVIMQKDVEKIDKSQKEIQDILFNKILQDKQRAEKAMQVNYYMSLLCLW